jgi:signal transduction histidine kinase
MDFKGLGIGLSLVQEIVHLHRGKIHVEKSEAGKGTTFVVVLPKTR